jgi:hypothetical protein
MFSVKRIGTVGIGVFLVVNTPSLKLLAGVTPLVNAAATSVLFAAALGRVLIHRSIQNNRAGWVLFTGIWLLFLLCVLPEHLLAREIDPGHSFATIRLLYALGCVAVIVATGTQRDIRSFIRCQVVWGAVIAGLQLTGIVTYSSSSPLHYKTVSLPIALSTLAIIGELIERSSISIRQVVLRVAIILVNVIALTSLFSRSPFVFTTIIVLGFTIAKQPSIAKKVGAILKMVGIVMVGAASVAALVWKVEIGVRIPAIKRLLVLFREGESERIKIWGEAIEIIVQNPLGVGFGAYEELSNTIYPHNIVIESGVVAGVLGSFLMLFLVFGYLLWCARMYRRANKNDKVVFVQSCFFGFYLVMTFTVSYSLSFSYMMFAMMALTTAFFQVSPPHYNSFVRVEKVEG